jgi:hypothetical protein
LIVFAAGHGVVRAVQKRLGHQAAMETLEHLRALCSDSIDEIPDAVDL